MKLSERLYEIGMELPITDREQDRKLGVDEMLRISRQFSMAIDQAKLLEGERSQCWWYPSEEYNENSVWETSCAEEFILLEGNPHANRMKFCPYCGDGLRQSLVTRAQAERDAAERRRQQREYDKQFMTVRKGEDGVLITDDDIVYIPFPSATGVPDEDLKACLRDVRGMIENTKQIEEDD